MAKIPRFKTKQEERTFWDTHSLADYEEDLRPANDIVFVKPDRQVVTLRLDKKIVKLLKTLGTRKGIGYSSLLRMWILEKFYQETHPHPKRS
ncbi:MAG: hypothetical protein HYS07_00760 [Chlamydiae bacterium]|nr:hypothetical protein [Chlamydiota bacterium]